MVKLPGVEQTPIRTTPVAPRADTSAVPRAISQFGKAVGEVGGHIQVALDDANRRNDAIEQARAREAFAAKAGDLFQKEQDEGTNFEDPEALARYRTDLTEEQSKILQNFKGSANAAARLTVSMEGIMGRSHAQATVTGRQSQQKAIKRQVDNFAGTLADEAAENPDRLGDIMIEFEKEIANYADALTPEQFTALHDGSASLIVGNTIERNIALGNLENAREIFERSRPLLTGRDNRKFNAQIVALEGATLRKGAEISARRARVVAAIGEENVTPQISLAIEGIVLPKRGPLTLTEDIADTEKVLGRRLTPREIGAKAGTHKKLPDTETDDKGIFGSGALGSAQELLATRHPDFMARVGQPFNEADRLYLAAVAIASRPNESTGIPGTLTPTTKEALRARGIDPRQMAGFPVIPGPEAPAAPPAPGDLRSGSVPTITPPAIPGQEAAAPAATGLAARSVEQAQGDAAFAEPGSGADKPFTIADAAEESRQFTEQGGLLSPQARLPNETIFGQTDILTGPISAIRGVGARIPLLGGLIEDPLTTRARTALPIITNDLLKILANNPKYAVTERTDLKEIVSLESKFFDRPENLRQQIIGLDTALEIREKNARQTIASEAVTRVEAEHALNILQGLIKFRKILGAPPVVRSAVEAKSLPLGAPFRIPGSDTIMYNRPKKDKK